MFVEAKTSIIGRLALLVALAATPAMASDRSSAGTKYPADPTIVRSLSDDRTDLGKPEEFVSGRLTDILDDEPAEPAAVPDAASDAAPAVPCNQCQPGSKCDCKKQKELKSKAAGAYKGLFYDNNFDYLCDPCYDDWRLGENFKRIGIGPWITYDIGGQFRMRQHAERNHRGLGLTGADDDFLLYRTRLYANVEVGNVFRLFAEGIDATSEYENFNPRPIEVNRTDMLNLFGDLRILNLDCGTLVARAGRQELLYGDQRVISPLDWANTRRTFDGYKMFWSGERFDADFFYTRPVRVDATHFDSVNHSQEFMGSYVSYKKLKRSQLDFYYLAFNNNVDNGGDFNYDTFGTRLKGAWEMWLWDFEGAYQSGNFEGNNHDAGAYTVGLGRKFERLKWAPTLWAYYDWASGDDVIGNGYHHQFPLAHKYLGYMDFFGRRNIKDANLLLTCSPHERVKLLFWYHLFRLQNRNDAPYNVNMTPFNAAGVPVGDKDLGAEIDATVSLALTPRANLVFGYSHFFAGDYFFTTPGVPYAGDADFFWTQFQVGF